MCRLKKSLYRLKQAPSAWYTKIDGFLLSRNFCRCKYYPNVYLKLIHGSLMIIVLYVYDFLITRSSKDEIPSLKDAMTHSFSMTDLGLLSQFLGIKIAQTKEGIKVHQSKYALDLLILNDWFGRIEQILGARDCSNQTRNQSTSVQVFLGFSKQIQHEGLQARKDSLPFRS